MYTSICRPICRLQWQKLGELVTGEQMDGYVGYPSQIQKKNHLVEFTFQLSSRLLKFAQLPRLR